MTLLFHIGIDPATHKMGVSVITHEGVALRPLEAFDGKQWSPHQTLSGGSKRDVHLRLRVLEDALFDYFDSLKLAIYGIYGKKDWAIASIGIERPVMNTYVQKGEDGKTKNRFDTTFALGRAFQMVVATAHELHIIFDYTFPIYEVLPSESSVALGLTTFATKKARNRRCASLEGGILIEQDEKKSDKDLVRGGRLHNCGPDALDAYAAAHAARKRYIEEQLANQARRESSKPSRKKKAA